MERKQNNILVNIFIFTLVIIQIQAIIYNVNIIYCSDIQYARDKYSLKYLIIQEYVSQSSISFKLKFWYIMNFQPYKFYNFMGNDINILIDSIHDPIPTFGDQDANFFIKGDRQEVYRGQASQLEEINRFEVGQTASKWRRIQGVINP